MSFISVMQRWFFFNQWSVTWAFRDLWQT